MCWEYSVVYVNNNRVLLNNLSYSEAYNYAYSHNNNGWVDKVKVMHQTENGKLEEVK